MEILEAANGLNDNSSNESFSPKVKLREKQISSDLLKIAEDNQARF